MPAASRDAAPGPAGWLPSRPPPVVSGAARRFPAGLLRGQVEAILRAWGLDGQGLGEAAGLIVEADLRAIDSHGVAMLAAYERMRRAGQLRLGAVPRILRERGSTALVDGGGGLGHPVAAFAMRLAIKKALACDIGVVLVRNSHHFGAAGLYAEMAARRGLIGIVSTTTRTVAVVPTNGAERVLGTNPFALAAPARRHPILLLDMSTSVVAANKVRALALKGEPLAAGWVLDAEGRSVLDAAAACDLVFNGTLGGLGPLGGAGTAGGGHKGYGLGVFAQVLAGTLGGGSFSPLRNRSQGPAEPDNIGHFFQALQPAAFRDPEAFLDEMDELIDTLRATRPADPAQPVLVPGDPEWRAREEREATGIPVPAGLLDELRGIAARAGAAFLLG